jgi:hypothetical protein
VLAEFLGDVLDGLVDVAVEFYFADPEFESVGRCEDVDGVESFDGVVVGVFVVDFADRWEGGRLRAAMCRRSSPNSPLFWNFSVL